jgi:hypothetical protein
VSTLRLLRPAKLSGEPAACGEGWAGTERAGSTGLDPRRDSNGNDFQISNGFRIWYDFDEFRKEIQKEF